MAQRHFPLGRTAHAACMQSVRGMLQLLKMTFTRAPEGIVTTQSYAQCWRAGKAADQWAAALAQGIRCAMGPCRLMAQQPKKFEARARFMSCWEKDKFKQLYKQPKPGEVFMDSQDTVQWRKSTRSGKGGH